MAAMKSVPIPVKKDPKGWVVGMASGERIFIKSKEVFQDETSITFHDGEDWNKWDHTKELVIQIERIQMSWHMPNKEELEVLIAAPPEEEDEDESED